MSTPDVLDQKCDFGEDWSFIYYGRYPILILMKTPIVKPVALKWCLYSWSLYYPTGCLSWPDGNEILHPVAFLCGNWYRLTALITSTTKNLWQLFGRSPHQYEPASYYIKAVPSCASQIKTLCAECRGSFTGTEHPAQLKKNILNMPNDAP